ncbi:MAG: type II glyceraldehyde-3-phosphate dehydrogenase [Desulfurococcaceae archaeon]
MGVKVAVNGYGTIGKRIADAVLRVKDFELVGVAKYTVDYSALLAHRNGIRIFTPREKFAEFRNAGVEPEGTVEDLVDGADIVYDASPGKQGAKNKELYVRYNKPAVFQGGESPEVAGLSYSTLCNYEAAIGKKYVRVVSCNTTGMLRIICSIGTWQLDSVFAVIVRRASDPREDHRGPVSSIALDSSTIPSHHALDVKTVVGDVSIETVALVVPTTLMHMQVMNVKLKKPLSTDELAGLLRSSGRILVLDSTLLKIDSTGKIVELSRDANRPRYDIYENVVFSNMVKLAKEAFTLVQAIHQEAIVIPENLDVAYAMMNLETDPLKVVKKVNEALGIGALQGIIPSEAKAS